MYSDQRVRVCVRNIFVYINVLPRSFFCRPVETRASSNVDSSWFVCRDDSEKQMHEEGQVGKSHGNDDPVTEPTEIVTNCHPSNMAVSKFAHEPYCWCGRTRSHEQCRHSLSKIQFQNPKYVRIVFMSKVHLCLFLYTYVCETDFELIVISICFK